MGSRRHEQRDSQGLGPTLFAVSLAALVPTYLAVTKHPPFWPVWIFLGLAVIGLYLIAAERRHLWPYRPQQLKLLVRPIAPEPLYSETHEPGYDYAEVAGWKLALLVSNLGETGTFVANTVSLIVGLETSNYRAGQLAWEGCPEPRVEIYGDGGFHVRVIGDYYRGSRPALRFRGPQSTYSGPGGQQRGREVHPTDEGHVWFLMELRETGSDRAIRYVVNLHFKGVPPTIEAFELT